MLDLSANEIEALPPLAAALPALAELVLDQNSLRSLGDELVGLTKLKKLSARSNRIAAADPFTGQQVRSLLVSLVLFVADSAIAAGRSSVETRAGCHLLRLSALQRAKLLAELPHGLLVGSETLAMHVFPPPFPN